MFLHLDLAAVVESIHRIIRATGYVATYCLLIVLCILSVPLGIVVVCWTLADWLGIIFGVIGRVVAVVLPAGRVVADFILRLFWTSHRRSSPHYFGPYHRSWLSLYDYCRDALPVRRRTVRRLEGLMNYADGVRRLHHGKSPNLVGRDARGRLHNETGPALSYPDGCRLYAWHGSLVPRWVIEDRDKITVAAIVTQRNTEIRRVMRHLYGLDRFMLDAGAQEVDRSEKHGARLVRIRLQGDPPEEICAVELTCPSTGSKYFERVPPDCVSVMDALAWRFQVEPKQYAPTWET